jgi:hypothetical protein
MQLFRHSPPDILVTNPETLHYQARLHTRTSPRLDRACSRDMACTVVQRTHGAGRMAALANIPEPTRDLRAGRSAHLLWHLWLQREQPHTVLLRAHARSAHSTTLESYAGWTHAGGCTWPWTRSAETRGRFSSSWRRPPSAIPWTWRRASFTDRPRRPTVMTRSPGCTKAERSDQRGAHPASSRRVGTGPRCLTLSRHRAIITLESHSRSKVAAAAIIESWINLKWRSLVYALRSFTHSSHNSLRS